ncbi:hypothetical protein [Salipiger sp. PrR002]|uniref:hypothetical protein n=1 Tax=Salipiger sp. PrR002 TaxID=2706489 RepID=UPI0013BD0B89|nr:hypothetical protein [Salipiger sp. PrR002]NDW00055.1 hypothetical protein [Salipiger sp. PrR002]NDW56936.1 hypothetical protein [Salipiger sp. PrR004]
MARGGSGNGAGVGGGNGGGRPTGAGVKKGELFGDMYVLLRDLDPTDGDGGNGEPVLDGNGNPILVGSDGDPIFYVADPASEDPANPDWILDPDREAFTLEVELERANVARAPDKVMEKALDAALEKIATADPGSVGTDLAGRITYEIDGTEATIDSPVENLALYRYLMTQDADGSDAGGWSIDLITAWPEPLQALVGDDPENPAWDPSSLLGAAFSKEGEVTLDGMLYENSVLGVNAVSQSQSGVDIDYFEFSDAGGETYNYDRNARYDGVEVGYYMNIDDDPDLEYQEGFIMDLVFGGEGWDDNYLVLADGGQSFTEEDATGSGANDFAQAADDARAVIFFMHEYNAFALEIA